MIPKGDSKQRCPDITCARTWLGWEPRVPLNVGLAKTVEHYWQLLAGSKSRPQATFIRLEKVVRWRNITRTKK